MKTEASDVNQLKQPYYVVKRHFGLGSNPTLIKKSSCFSWTMPLHSDFSELYESWSNLGDPSNMQGIFGHSKPHKNIQVGGDLDIPKERKNATNYHPHPLADRSLLLMIFITGDE